MIIKIKHSEIDIFWLGDPERAHCKKDGKPLNGHYEYFYDNGVLRTKGTWINGMKEGAWSHFHENGKIWSRGFFHNDKRFPSTKFWETYDENGKLIWSPRMANKRVIKKVQE